jgi:hypothetical protein
MIGFILSLLFDPRVWIGVAIGLIVGWNLLPQPAAVKRAYDRVRAWWNRVTTRDYDPFD